MLEYCERTATGFWPEPLNTLSNLAFIITALPIWLNYRRLDITIRSSWDFMLLLLCLLAIGIGSTLWHTWATRWTLLADVIPITLFINIFLLSFLYRIARCRSATIFFYFFIFQLIGVATLAWFPDDFMNGSINYVPAYLALLAMTVYSFCKHSVAAHRFIVAAAVFSGSLLFRTIDQAVCNQFPVGTHFLWHLLNAAVLYCLLDGLIRTLETQTEQTRPAS
jgi:hypothetical protein